MTTGIQNSNMKDDGRQTNKYAANDDSGRMCSDLRLPIIDGKEYIYCTIANKKSCI